MMETLLMMSLAGGLLAMLVMAVRAMLGSKLHPRVVYALWLPVLLCLLVPLRIPSGASVLNAPPAQRIQTVISSAAVDAQQTPAPTQAQIKPNVALPAKNGKQAAPRVSPWQVICLLWAVGAAVTGAYVVAVNVQFRMRVRRSRRGVDLPWVLRQQVRRVPVYVSKAVASPCLVGLVRPYIVVTPGSMENTDRLSHVLMHEMCHLRQGDALFSVLRSAVLIVHWFNPVVWIAAGMSRADCENACDALVINRLGEAQRIDYGKTLLSFLRSNNPASGLVNTATTMAQSRGQIRRRIALLSKKRKYTSFLAILVVALVLTGCAMTMTDANTPGQPTQPAQGIPSPSAQVAPTQPVIAIIDNVPNNVRNFVTDYESVIAETGFRDMTTEELKPWVDALEGDFELYGRINGAGDSYFYATCINPPYDKVEWSAAEVYTDNRYFELYAYDGEIGNETYKKYTLEDVAVIQLQSLANRVQNAEWVVVVSCGEHSAMMTMPSSSNRQLEQLARTMNLTTVQPREPYMMLTMLNDRTTNLNGGGAVVMYAGLGQNDELLQHISAQPLQQSNGESTWAGVWLVKDQTTTYRLCTDHIAVFDSEAGAIGIIDHDEIENALRERVEQSAKFDPIWQHDQWLSKPLSSAKFAYPDHNTGNVAQQTITDADKLDQLCNLISARTTTINGGTSCPFGGRMELTRQDGKEMVLYFSSDGCDVFTYEGGIYYELLDGIEAIFSIFDECAPSEA